MAVLAPQTTGAIESALSTLIESTTGGSIDASGDPRSALVFTSTLRQSKLRDITTRAQEVANEIAANVLLAQTQTVTPTATRVLTSGTAQRARFTELEDLTGQLQNAMPSITMALNPKVISFDQPKRFFRQDVVKGTVFHHFTNNKGQNNDLLTIRLQANTGNINPDTFSDDGDKARARQKLLIWHNLYQMTREPIHLSDGLPNEWTITYVSNLFPVQIAFSGFFAKVAPWEESGNKPNSVDFSAEFIVQRTSPDLDVMLDSIVDFMTASAQLVPTDDSRIIGGTL